MIIAKKLMKIYKNFQLTKIFRTEVKSQNLMERLSNVTFPSPIGTVCKIYCNNNDSVTGEIIGFRENKNLIAAHEQNANLISGSIIEALDTNTNIEVGDEILGRVIDAFGDPIDEEKNKISLNDQWPLNGKPINPMRRKTN